MNTAKLKTGLGLLLLAALILSSACDNSLGFFSGIQTETVQSANKIFVETETRDIVAMGGSYYAVTKGIYTRSAATGSSWNLVSNAAFGDNYRCVGIAVVGGTDLYVAIRGSESSGGAMKGIFMTTTGSSWTLVDSAFSTAKDIQTLYSATDRLYAVANESGSYNLYHLSGTFVDSGLASSTTLATGVVKVGANYWTVQGDKVFNDTTDTTAPSGSNFSGIATDGTNIYVVSAGRNVYKYSGIWSAPLSLSATTTELPSGMAYIADPAATPRLVVGLSGAAKGYYEVASDLSGSAIACTSTSGKLVPPENATSNSLKDKPIVRFVRLGNSLFACAASGSSEASSLWRNDWSGSAWSGWVAE